MSLKLNSIQTRIHSIFITVLTHLTSSFAVQHNLKMHVQIFCFWLCVVWVDGWGEAKYSMEDPSCHLLASFGGTNRSSAFGHGIEILVWFRHDRYTSSTFQYKEFDGFKRTPFNITMDTFSPCCHQRSLSSRRSDKWNNTQKNLGISFTGFSGMLPGRHIIIRHLPGLTWEGSLALNTRII